MILLKFVLLNIFFCKKNSRICTKRIFDKKDETDNTTNSESDEEEISLNGFGSGTEF